MNTKVRPIFWMFLGMTLVLCTGASIYRNAVGGPVGYGNFNTAQFYAPSGGTVSHLSSGNLGTNMTLFGSSALTLTNNIGMTLERQVGSGGITDAYNFGAGAKEWSVSVSSTTYEISGSDGFSDVLALRINQSQISEFVGGITNRANYRGAGTLEVGGDITSQGGATIVSFLSIPNAAAPTTDAFGEIAADNNAWAASRGALQIYDGTANTYAVATLASDAPANGQEPVWNTGGTVTWEYRARPLDFQSTTTGNVGAGEDTIYTYTVPASTLAVNDQAVGFDIAGSFAANGNNKRIRVKFGATTIYDMGAVAISGEEWRICGKVYRTGAATQKAIVSVGSTTAGSMGTSVEYTTPAETLSGTVVLTITAEATADNDVVGQIWKVNFEP